MISVGKARLLEKKLGQVVKNEVTLKNFPTAKTFDDVLILTKNGKKMLINTLRDEQGRPLSKRFINEGKNLFYQRVYSYDTLPLLADSSVKYPSRRVLSAIRNKKDVFSRTEEVFTVNDNLGKPVVTKSKYGTKVQIGKSPAEEISGIAQYRNGETPNFYTTWLQKDEKGKIIQKHVLHSKDAIPKEIYDSEYIHTLTQPMTAYKQNIFNELINKNGLGGENIKLVPKHYGKGNPKDGVQFGGYNNNDKTLKYNIDYHGTNTKPFFLNVAEHELTHAKQYKEIELLKAGKLTGRRAENAKQYDYEFNNYIDFSKDQTKYENQLTEKEALDKGWDSQYDFCKMVKLIAEKFEKGTLVEKQIPGTWID